MYKIIESTDYVKLSSFFNKNGLEVEIGMERPDNVVKCWECDDPSNNRPIAGASLEKRKGEFVVANVAVDEEYREGKIGTQLMNIVEEEIKKLGGKEAWLVAKVPGFYAKLGWKIISKEKAPDISSCFTCSKYGNECTPQVMYKIF